jgi:hypothetical protein
MPHPHSTRSDSAHALATNGYPGAILPLGGRDDKRYLFRPLPVARIPAGRSDCLHSVCIVCELCSAFADSRTHDRLAALRARNIWAGHIRRLSRPCDTKDDQGKARSRHPQRTAFWTGAPAALRSAAREQFWAAARPFWAAEFYLRRTYRRYSGYPRPVLSSPIVTCSACGTSTCEHHPFGCSIARTSLAVRPHRAVRYA